MTTNNKTFKVGEALEKVQDGSTIHCLGTDETITKSKVEGGLHVDLAVGKNISRMPAQNFLGTYCKADFADGPAPKTPAPAADAK